MHAFRISTAVGRFSVYLSDLRRDGAAPVANLPLTCSSASAIGQPQNNCSGVWAYQTPNEQLVVLRGPSPRRLGPLRRIWQAPTRWRCVPCRWSRALTLAAKTPQACDASSTWPRAKCSPRRLRLRLLHRRVQHRAYSTSRAFPWRSLNPVSTSSIGTGTLATAPKESSSYRRTTSHLTCGDSNSRPFESGINASGQRVVIRNGSVRSSSNGYAITASGASSLIEQVNARAYRGGAIRLSGVGSVSRIRPPT